MRENIKVEQPTNSPTVNLAIDTVKLGKQALIFVNTRQSAEKEAEEIGRELNLKDEKLQVLASEALDALPRPTKQCEKLARCIRGGAAFHHSGLTAKQRQIIEENFRNGTIKIICCTPTLAAGIDLPAFRAIIRDLKRFSDRGEYGYGGMGWIPVLEYLQMCGRAGRPSFDNEGQALILAQAELAEEEISQRYIHGQPEEIYSKLAVEPVLRTHVLSLVATGVIGSREEIMAFFSKTFWACQYKDLGQLERRIDKIVAMLRDWSFVKKADDFLSASELETIRATALGERVAQLYLDPLTAHEMILGLKKVEVPDTFQLLQLISSRLEMRPLIRVKTKEMDELSEKISGQSFLVETPSVFEEGYEEFLASVKTAGFFQEWIDEKDEEYLLEKYGTRPGEVHSKLENADWLLYASAEIAKLVKIPAREISKLRVRIKYGAKEELMPLLQLKNIGRVRARRLFENKIRDLGDAKKTDAGILAQILGAKIAADIKEQLGQKAEPVKEGKRKGQINLKDYG